MYDVWLYIDQLYYPVNHNPEKPPTFDLARHLHKQEIISFGQKKSVTFFAEYDEKTDKYFLPLCTINWETVFDGNMPITMKKETSWLINGKFVPIQKITLKIAKPKIFLQKMRSRIIEELIDLADNFGFEDKIKALYEQHSELVYIYKEGGSPKFRDAIAASVDSWLDEVIPATGNKPREVLLNYLEVGVVDGTPA